MKKTIITLFIFTLTLAFVSCRKDKDPEPDPIPVLSVTISPKLAIINPGDTIVLTATVFPSDATNDSVVWSYFNDRFAYIEVTGKTFKMVAQERAWEMGVVVTSEDGNIRDTAIVKVVTPLGEVSFVTDSTWEISHGDITQIWSDAVQTSVCSDKTFFSGGDPEKMIFVVDCRNNDDQKGDLFSWEFVNHYKDALCPGDWRVPTRKDFQDLDAVMNAKHGNEVGVYATIWGGTNGGRTSVSPGSIGSIDFASRNRGYYWSSDQVHQVAYTFDVDVTWRGSAGNLPHHGTGKWFGLSLRCVK